MSEERARRVGLNEALFREVNDRIESLNTAFAKVTDKIDIVCECGSLGCAATIGMTPQEYAELRSDSALFAVVHGHEASDVESVVDRRDTYDVVRKNPGLPARLASETDSRAG